jgi:hypothetical protein
MNVVEGPVELVGGEFVDQLPLELCGVVEQLGIGTISYSLLVGPEPRD